MKKFFKSLLALILILVIVGGLGYIGYSYYFMNPSSMSFLNGQADISSQNMNQDSMNMQNGSMTDQTPNASTEVLEAVRVAMANKESLDTAVTALNEAMYYLTLDPYSPSEKADDMGSMNEVQAPQTTPAANPTQSNTTINIYPNTNNTQQDTSTPNMTMTNMGTVYDANKMEQLHSGLYKLSVGMQLLGQLKNDLSTQTEYANKDIQNSIQYYSNQYALVVQNKNKLNNALTYINEASSLVNINPYVSEKGLVYDKDRMKKIHESIFKMAQGVASLNKLSADMTIQAVNTANAAQNYINNANMNSNMGTMNNSTGGILDGISTNVNMPTIVNIILILFVTLFILGLFGFIFSLLKTTKKSLSNDNNTKD
jgi:flagellar basal body-associated protein FliL